MTDIERTAYPRFKPSVTRRELEHTYQPTAGELHFAKLNGRNDETQLRVLVLLKVFQRLGYFPSLKSIPSALIDYLRIALNLISIIPFNRKIDPSKHYPAVYRFVGVHSYKEGGQTVVESTLQRLLSTMDDPADLINAILEELVRQRFALPGFTVLDDYVLRVREAYHRELHRQVVQTLTDEERERLDNLLRREPESIYTGLYSLKQPPGPARLTEIRDLIVRLSWLDGLLETRKRLANFPPAKRTLFATQATALETHDFFDLSIERRYTLLTCLVYQAQAQVRDNLVEMFVKKLSSLHKTAIEKLEIIRQKQRETTENILDTFGKIVEATRIHEDDAELGQDVRLLLENAGGTAALTEHYVSIAAHHGNNYLPLLPASYASSRKTLFRLLNLLQLRSTTGDVSLLDAFAYLYQHLEDRSEWFQAPIVLDFISPKWWQVIVRDERAERWLHRRLLELCVFSNIAVHLKAGDICVVDADDYADYRDQLLPWDECPPLIQEHCQALGIPATPEAFGKMVKTWLEKTAEEVDAAAPDNTFLFFKPDGTPRLHRSKPRPLPTGFDAMYRELKRRMPQRSLLEILANLEHWSHFTRHFTSALGQQSHATDAAQRYVLTVFTYGCNLGPTQMEQHSRAISARVVSRLNRQHVTHDSLEAARRDIIHYYKRLDLPSYWGKGTAAAADGTLFDVYRHNLLAEYHIRYGRYGGIAYHHVSDTYIALFSHFIACGVREAVYILDGLLKNRSDIQPDTLHADTHGQSETVYGLSYLLGIQLMPRIRRWHDLTFYRSTSTIRYPHIDALFSDKVNWHLIVLHWRELMQIIVSIRAGRLMPSTLLRKLGNYSSKNRIHQAFQELGRVVRTVFLLRYIASEALRRKIHAATTIVEAYHKLTKWCSFGEHGVITSNDPVEQEKRVKYTDVVACAIILQNAVDMTHVLRQMTNEGYSISSDMIARCSPYLSKHIRRFGEYVLDMSQPPPPLDLDTPLFPLSNLKT